MLGKGRYTSTGGLERKTKPDEYVEKVARLIEKDRGAVIFGVACKD